MEKMEKGTVNAKGVFFALQSVKGKKLYKRVFVSSKGAKITERGITWLGSFQTHRNKFGCLKSVSFTLNFNLLWITILAAVVYFSVVGLLIGLWEGIKWCGQKIKSFFGLKIKGTPILWWIISILVWIIGACLLYRNCNRVNPEPEAQVVIEQSDNYDADWNADLYDACIYYACCVKGYLDGYQTEAKPLGNGRYILMLGVSEQNGKWVEKSDKIAKADIYHEMVKYFIDKRGPFISSLQKVFGSEEMISLQLVSQRMGMSRFSDGDGCELLKAINNNEEDVAKLFRLPGTDSRNAENQESLKYFWVLYQIYCRNLSVDDVFNFPMQSYLNIPLEDMYENDLPVWNEDLAKRLAQGKQLSFKASGVMPEN